LAADTAAIPARPLNTFGLLCGFLFLGHYQLAAKNFLGRSHRNDSNYPGRINVSSKLSLTADLANQILGIKMEKLVVGDKIGSKIILMETKYV